MKKFLINDFLTLKLVTGKTYIYVNGKRFNQCKFLMLNIPKEETKKLDKIGSIDEVADILGWKNDGQIGVKYDSFDDKYILLGVKEVKLDPESEFWGHCSNLQVWYEHNYDTRLLHSTLAFPLLQKLAEVGDPVAKKVFQEEIIKRYESGNPNIHTYILKNRLLEYLDKEKKINLINQQFSGILTAIGKLPKSFDESEVINDLIYDKREGFSQLLKIAKEKGQIKKLFSILLESIEKFPDTYDKYYNFSALIESIENIDIINNNISKVKTIFLDLANKINKISKDDQSFACSQLIKVAKKSGLVEEYIPTLLDAFSYVDYDIDYDAYYVYGDLLTAITNKTQKFETIKLIIENTEDPYLKPYVANILLSLVEDSKFVKENFVFIMFSFEEVMNDNLSCDDFNFYESYIFIVKFIEKLINIGVLNVKITENSSYYVKDYDERVDHCIKGFYTLIKELEDTEIMEHLLPSLLKTFWNASFNELYSSDSYELFSLLFKIAYKKKLLDKLFIYFIIYYNWDYIDIENLLNIFLNYLNREEIVSLLVPSLNNLDLLLEYRNYKRVIPFFERLANGRDNPLYRSLIVHILKKNSSKINIFLFDKSYKYYLHYLKA